VAAFVDVVAARTEYVVAFPRPTADGEIPVEEAIATGKTTAVKTKPTVVAKAKIVLADCELAGSRAMGNSHRAFGTSWHQTETTLILYQSLPTAGVSAF
jgi:hypothetical protein